MTKAHWIEKITGAQEGEGITVEGRVPESAEFFQDHFPDFPILPGVLMLEIFKQAVEKYLESTHSVQAQDLRLLEVQNVKFTQFLKPGEEWQAVLELLSQSGSGMEWRGKLSSENRIAASARLIFEFAPEAAFHPKEEKGD